MAILAYDLDATEGLGGPRLRALLDLGFPCNLACGGCARGRQRGRPNRSAALAVADRLAGLVGETGAAATSLVLFGGEPLLDADAVVSCSALVRDACAREGCGYEATVMTNATLLDGFVARRLSRAGVTTLQVTIPVRGRVAPEGSLDRQRFARMVRSMREARDELEVLVRFEVNGTDDLREALSTVRVLEHEGLLSPPRPAAVLLGPRASYAAQARALFVARPARAPTALTRCP